MLTLLDDLTGKLYGLLARVRGVRRGFYADEPSGDKPEIEVTEKKSENSTFLELFHGITNDNIKFLNALEAEIDMLEKF